VNNVKKETMEDLYQKTIDRTLQLENKGFKVVEMWSCRWKKIKDCKQYSKSIEIIEPLNPRDALYGGRTEVFKLRSDGELLGYGDVVSLYPTVMYYDYYPVGHPTKIFYPQEFDNNWFGFIACKVLAPQNLYHPVLPVHVKMGPAEKLVFPLCVKCAETRKLKCDHNLEERQFFGTWSTEEIKKALEKGYQITKIYEVWHFEKSNDLWKGYISDFMKIKLETSPHNYPTNDAYANEIRKKMGIHMNPEAIQANPGKRAVAKLCLNSLWGKFGQRLNMGETEFVTDRFRLCEILMDDRLIDENIIFINDKMMQVDYKYKDTFVKNNFNTNVFVAAYTTANARLRLYDQLDRKSRDVMYCDTDSIIYKHNGANNLPYGDMLGEWTDELGGENIIKFVATGPKSYHYQTDTGKTVTKVKGFTLHHKNAEKINAETMEQLIASEIHSVTVKNEEITRDPKTKQLVNRDQTKTFSFDFDKRIIIDNFDTVPYGYIEEE